MYVFTYLTMPGLSCDTQYLRFLLQHAGSLVAACGIYFPNQGLIPGPLHWECGVLATGLPGKLEFFFKALYDIYYFETCFFFI